MATYGKIQGKCAVEEIVHTRVGDCDAIPAITKTLLLTPLNFTFPTTSSEAMVQALKQGVLAGLVIPINGITGEDGSGGEAATFTTLHGPNIYTGVTAKTVPYQLAGTGACMMKALQNLNLKHKRIIKIDVNGMVWGNAVSDTVGRGFRAQLLFTDAEATNETTPYLNYLNVAYSSDYASEKANGFALEATADFDGLTGITLVPGAASGQAQIVNACSGKDEGVEIAAMLDGSDAKALLVNDAGVNPTAATIDPDTGLITGITPTAPYRIVSAAVLDSLNVVGYDGIKKLVDLTGNPDA